MLNEVKHLYNKDSSLTLRMTVSVIIYIVTKIFHYLCARIKIKVRKNYLERSDGKSLPRGKGFREGVTWTYFHICARPRKKR